MSDKKSAMFADSFYVVASMNIDECSLTPLQICGSIKKAYQWVHQLIDDSIFSFVRDEKRDVAGKKRPRDEPNTSCYHLIQVKYNEWIMGLEKSVGYFLKQRDGAFSFTAYSDSSFQMSFDLIREMEQNSTFMFPPQLYLEVETDPTSIAQSISKSEKPIQKRWRITLVPNYFNLLFPISPRDLLCQIPKNFDILIGVTCTKSVSIPQETFPWNLIQTWNSPLNSTVDEVNISGSKRQTLKRTQRMESLLDLFK